MAKTTWDSYVKVLETNANLTGMDAFVAFFSPIAAPTPPALPYMPWVPTKYNGYVK